MACKRADAARTGPSAQASDDLTVIKGVGPKSAARLQHSGILTFAQLARLSAEEIAARVGGLSTRRITRENWIKQARRLAPKTASARVRSGEATGRFRQHYATFTVELLLDEGNDVRRTRVTHIQNQVEKTWAGWEEQKLSDFFVQSAELHVPALMQTSTLLSSGTGLTQAPSTATSSGEISPARCRAGLGGTLEVEEMTVLDVASSLPRYSCHVQEPFYIRLILDLTHVNPAPSTPLYYTITIWAKKLGTGIRETGGEGSGILEPVDKASCMVRAIISSPGRYRLAALVTLTHKSVAPSPRSALRAWKEGSVVQVY